MKPEVEATFINIDPDALRAKLRSAGATLILPETLMNRTIFDTGEHSFLRVRNEGNKITITYKRVDELSLSGSKEINLDINNYDAAIELFKTLGLEPKAVQETKREEWKLDGVEFDIDTWPWLPTYVEVEGPDEESVKAVITKIGFNLDHAHYGSVDEIYKLYYDVTNNDINFCPEITFKEIPDWLESKRRPETPEF